MKASTVWSGSTSATELYRGDGASVRFTQRVQRAATCTTIAKMSGITLPFKKESHRRQRTVFAPVPPCLEPQPSLTKAPTHCKQQVSERSSLVKLKPDKRVANTGAHPTCMRHVINTLLIVANKRLCRAVCAEAAPGQADRPYERPCKYARNSAHLKTKTAEARHSRRQTLRAIETQSERTICSHLQHTSTVCAKARSQDRRLCAW